MRCGDGSRDRFVENEKLFRTANEGLRERVEGSVEPDQSIPFLCECIDETCMARIDLTSQEYEIVRSDDQWFVIAQAIPASTESASSRRRTAS